MPGPDPGDGDESPLDLDLPIDVLQDKVRDLEAELEAVTDRAAERAREIDTARINAYGACYLRLSRGYQGHDAEQLGRTLDAILQAVESIARGDH